MQLIKACKAYVCDLTAEQAQAWLRALNDVRLALGVRLEVTEEIHDEIAAMSEDDPRYAAHVTYDWLTYLQDTLVRALWWARRKLRAC